MIMSNHLIKALIHCEEELQNQTENQAQWEMTCRKIGNILQSMGWFDEALLWHSRLLESPHNLVEIYKDLAILYTRLEKWEEAIYSYEKLLNINPNDVESYYSLQIIYNNLGNKEQETECLFQIITLQPEKVKLEGYHKLGKKFQETKKNEKAITCYLRSIESEPQFLKAYYDLGELYTLEGYWEKAIDIYNKLLIKNEKQALAHYNIAKLWWEQENYSEAISSLTQAALINPNLAKSYFDFAITLTQKDKLDEVINLCRALISAKITPVWTYIQLGNALVKKGQTQEASLCYQQAGKLRGWSDSVSKNYQFTKDFFNYKIEVFEKYLEHLVDQPLINGLEIVCQEGMSTCWLLDNILTEATAQLVCIDDKFTELFHENIAKTGVKNKVTFLEGNILKILDDLKPKLFDFINIQDNKQPRKRIEKITDFCGKLVQKGGLIIFNQKSSKANQNPEDNMSKEIMDIFLTLEKGDFESVYEGQNLLIIKKTN